MPRSTVRHETLAHMGHGILAHMLHVSCLVSGACSGGAVSMLAGEDQSALGTA